MKAQFNLLKTLTICLLLLLLQTVQTVRSQGLTEYLRGNLHVVQGSSTTLIDGNLTHYHSSNSNSVDYYDAWKMSNPGENFGIVRDGVTLAVERRKIFTMTDTTYFKIWNLRQQTYMIELVSSNLNHPNVTAFLVDQFLNKRSPVTCHGTTRYNFEVNADPRSYDPSRFKVIFRYNIPSGFPVKITGIRLFGEPGRTTRITWDVAKEVAIDRYDVEKSINGIDFEPIDIVVPENEGNNVEYSVSDNNCLEETYYRIKGTKLDGTAFYSGIARIKPIAPSNEIAIYPNPIVNKEAQVYTNEAQPGVYKVMLFGTNGELRMKSAFQVREGQNLNKVYLPANTNPGIYQMQIIRPDNSRVTKTISVL